MAIGTVTRFNTTQSFGLMIPQDGGKAFFVRSTAVRPARLHAPNAGRMPSSAVAMARSGTAANHLNIA
jgi:cold shock CspA family protein